MEKSHGSIAVVRKPPLAQIVLCDGCCCGKTERGFAPVPVEQWKAIWKAEKLNRTIQLTVSGCLGPCELANVVLLLVPDSAGWFGAIRDQASYELILDWVRRCHASQSLAESLVALSPHQFERFGANRGVTRRAAKPLEVIRCSGVPNGANS